MRCGIVKQEGLCVNAATSDPPSRGRRVLKNLIALTLSSTDGARRESREERVGESAPRFPLAAEGAARAFARWQEVETMRLSPSVALVARFR